MVPADREAAASGAKLGDPTDCLVWELGALARCESWLPLRKIPLEDGTSRLLPVLVIKAAHSHSVLAKMIPARKTEDVLLGAWKLLG